MWYLTIYQDTFAFELDNKCVRIMSVLQVIKLYDNPCCHCTDCNSSLLPDKDLLHAWYLYIRLPIAFV